MLPAFITPTELRKQLAKFLQLASHRIIVVKDKETNKVIIDEREYNRLSSLANQFLQEDPEGAYKKGFVDEMKGIVKDRDDLDKRITSLEELNEL